MAVGVVGVVVGRRENVEFYVVCLVLCEARIAGMAWVMSARLVWFMIVEILLLLFVMMLLGGGCGVH